MDNLKNKLRIQITKEENIRFISHLEYVRTIERAIRRAKIPIAYSEGFNPHMRFSLASALGVGIRSKAEFVEIELAEDIDLFETMKKLNWALPVGIKIVKADIVPKKTKKLMAQAAGADYSVIVPAQDFDIKSKVLEYNNSSEVLFQKIKPKSKGKTKEIDVKSFVGEIKAEKIDFGIKIDFSIKITLNGSMKAIELLEVLKEQFEFPIDLEKADVLRVDLYAEDENHQKKSLLLDQYLAN